MTIRSAKTIKAKGIFVIDPSWSFENALSTISIWYRPGSIIGGPQRNRQIESWGQLAGRTRALAEFDEAINNWGSATAFGRAHQITTRTLRGLREFFEALPDDHSKPRLGPGRTFGRWRLSYRLGAGGNADVWAARSDETTAAIKILRRPKGKPLDRFREEIAILDQLGAEPGILPKLDSALPKAPFTDTSAWLVLPLATPLLKSINESTSPSVLVDGVAQIATTMAKLHARGIAHRDLKPDNLYHWKGDWVISDFGIASFPGKTSLTSGNSKLGPLHFIAPEMLHFAESANGPKADVYSLAKTLWVLLAGEKFPPPGEHRSEIEQMQIGKWVALSNASALDEILEQATRYDPVKRISMGDLNTALREWLSNQPTDKPK